MPFLGPSSSLPARESLSSSRSVPAPLPVTLTPTQTKPKGSCNRASLGMHGAGPFTTPAALGTLRPAEVWLAWNKGYPGHLSSPASLCPPSEGKGRRAVTSGDTSCVADKCRGLYVLLSTGSFLAPLVATNGSPCLPPSPKLPTNNLFSA